MLSEDISHCSYEALLARLERLEDTHNRERVDEQLRLEPQIQAVKQLLIKRCQQEASRLRANSAFEAALNKWREVLSYQADHPEAPKAIAELNQHLKQQAKITHWNKQLSRFQELRLIFKELSAALKKVDNNHAYQTLTEQVEELLMIPEPDVKSFLRWWGSEYQSTSKTNGVDLPRLSERIKRGEIVLFIGSGLASLNDDDDVNLAENLASQIGYAPFYGSLSSIAEYYQLRPDYGQSALLRNLSAQLSNQNITFYQSLAQVANPLILISAAYDNGLEQAFSSADKRYVELSSIVKRSQDYDIGHVLVRYSDGTEAAQAIPEEQLSKLRLLEMGYSIIYKIRGTCSISMSSASEDDVRHDALTLSESSYFNFARYADRIIPNYLARQWRNRGFLFIAYRPKDWEDRLLASALLEKRSAQEPCYVIGTAPEPLEQAYWEARSVKQYQVQLADLERCLAKVML